MYHIFWLAKPYGLEVVLHSNLQISGKKTKNVLENGVVNTGPNLTKKLAVRFQFVIYD